jgi:DNA-binding NtrC family response regulator
VLPTPPLDRGASSALLGEDSAMLRLREMIARFAPSDAPVLILGESGSGKELVAHDLHRCSARASGPLVALNCAAFPDALLESELFGHEKGAFTGAARRRIGHLQAADGGTLFLAEVAEMTAPAQAKLLRALESGEFMPLGASEPVRVDVRVLSATHVDLMDRVRKGQFREDLFYRLKVLELRVPPLRERRGDLRLLCDHFLALCGQAAGAARLTDSARAALVRYPFPGNVRELEHALWSAAILSGGDPIEVEHLPPEIAAPFGDARGPLGPLSEALSRFERDYLRQALAATGGRRAEAARLLGISRKTLWERLRRHRL